MSYNSFDFSPLSTDDILPTDTHNTNDGAQIVKIA